jgi:integrating conjugative element protein (TIGR03752 family)
VFDDGTISTTTSNDNDIGNFTKSNSLGYLSDQFGNPFIRGKLITNAPAYLSGNVAIGAATGAANAYAQSQTTNSNSLFGSATSAVTGSQGKFVAGQALSNASNQVQQWWHDREEQSFDAIYVAPVDEKQHYVEIAVNFAKEIHIDYDPNGRKLHYAHFNNVHASVQLD